MYNYFQTRKIMWWDRVGMAFVRTRVTDDSGYRMLYKIWRRHLYITAILEPLPYHTEVSVPACTCLELGEL